MKNDGQFCVGVLVEATGFICSLKKLIVGVFYIIVNLTSRFFFLKFFFILSFFVDLINKHKLSLHFFPLILIFRPVIIFSMRHDYAGVLLFNFVDVLIG